MQFYWINKKQKSNQIRSKLLQFHTNNIIYKLTYINLVNNFWIYII